MSIYLEKNKKTKKLIVSCFVALLDEKAFEAITIGDITNKANINRGTFYLHYQDKFDLLEQIEQNLFENLGTHIDKLQDSYSQAKTFDKTQEQLASTLFSFIELYSPILKVLLGNKGRAGFHFRFRDVFMYKVRANIERNEWIEKEVNVPTDYFLSFITSAFLGLIEQWIQNELDRTPEEMTLLYIDIINYIKKDKNRSSS